MSSDKNTNDQVSNSRAHDPKRALAEGNSLESMTAAFIEMIKDFFKHLFGASSTPYSSDRNAQQVTENIIQGLDEKSQENIKEGNYTEGYLFARQKAYLEAVHETAMSPDITNEKDAVKVAAARAEEKIQDLDKKDFAQVAKNDYMSSISESELAKIHHKVSSEAGEMYSQGFDRDAQRLVAGVIGEDLNKIIEEQSAIPLSPAEKESGLKKEQQMANESRQERAMEMNQDNDMDSPTSGPGR